MKRLNIPTHLYASLLSLTNRQAGIIFKAILTRLFSPLSQPPDIKDHTAGILLNQLLQQIDADDYRQQLISKRRSEAGKRGGRPRKNAAKPQSKAFTPPTEEMVQQAMQEYTQAYNVTPDFTAKIFCDYYTSVGWKVGKSLKPMKNWRSALAQWFQQPSNSTKLTNLSDETTDWSAPPPVHRKTSEADAKARFIEMLQRDAANGNPNAIQQLKSLTSAHAPS